MTVEELKEGFLRLAGFYDLLLGLAFFFSYPWVYEALGIPLPPEPAYLHAAAGFVFVQGIMYFLVEVRTTAGGNG